MNALTLGEIKSRMLKEKLFGNNGVSLYYNEFGPIIASILFTQWPQTAGKPILFSHKHLAMWQLASLCHAMLSRCSLQNLNHINELPLSSIANFTEAQRENINQRLFARLNRPVLYSADPKGMKLSKSQALAWARLNTLEGFNLLTEYHASTSPGLISNHEQWTNYKEEAAFLMYCISCGDHNALAKVDALLNEAMHILDVSWLQMDIIRQNNYLYHYNIDMLEAFYDHFIVYLTELDIYFSHKYRKGISQMAPEQIQNLSVDQFPKVDPLLKIVSDGGELLELRKNWRAQISYDNASKSLLITKILAPEQVVKEMISR